MSYIYDMGQWEELMKSWNSFKESVGDESALEENIKRIDDIMKESFETINIKGVQYIAEPF